MTSDIKHAIARGCYACVALIYIALNHTVIASNQNEGFILASSEAMTWNDLRNSFGEISSRCIQNGCKVTEEEMRKPMDHTSSFNISD